MEPELDDIVDDVLRRRPATIRVFLDFKLRCVGCPVSCFHSIGDAAQAHGVSPAVFLAALRQAMADQDSD
ncbi:DUF1858 domain-containing protein [uncultured Ferrovibrio sp.]|jgi:hybrid cluster-associated redox disulfide protein|uniref:DUF1858 domain-containing protein n=1 Tax=uncultured Ferrovibrio sp. TaxID=1576913 RepID=UPI0026103CCC|nr:DUF1858 domain-containing protein [uncultured Ferrovibrio sp.]